MNIFVTNEDPQIAARDHCDKHLLKMIVETAQLLSTAVRHISPSTSQERFDDLGIYRPTHFNHPCSVWARQSPCNAAWLLDLGISLCWEYTNRYGKKHKTENILLNINFLMTCVHGEEELNSQRHEPFVIAAPMPFRMYAEEHGVIPAYRVYIASAKRKFAKWNHGPTPEWWSWAVAESDKLFGEVTNLADDGVFDNAEKKDQYAQVVENTKLESIF